MPLLHLPTCTIDLEERRLIRVDGEERISRREAEVLAYLAGKKGALVSREELEREVWRFSPGVLSEAVPVAIRRLRARIEVDARNPRILLTEYARGWRMVLEDGAGLSHPTAAGVLFGRTQEVASVADGWGVSDTQVIVGPGGVGKTTLARAVMPKGAVFIDLSHATTGAQCLEAIRGALPGLPLDGLEEAEALARIHHRLVALPLTVLDNVEQVLEPLAELVVQWKNARLLLTSRERMGVPGERVIRLDPLPIDDAVDLFCNRHRLAGGTAELDPVAVARVVERVDRLPLAIELLAPRARVVSLDTLADRLASGIDAIPSARGRSPRHSSIRSCLQWSWQALDVHAQDTLRAAATFATPFRLDALEQVLGSDPLDALDRLIDGALVVDLAPGRYTLRLLVKSFVLDQPGLAPFEERHAVVFVGLLDAVPRGVERVRELVRMIPELKLVVDRARSEEAVYRGALGVYQAIREEGLVAITREVLGCAIGRVRDPGRRADLLVAMADVAVHGGEDAMAWLAVAEPERCTNPSEYYTVWMRVALTSTLQPPPIDAHRAAVEAHPSTRSLAVLALARWIDGDAVEAERLIRRSMSLSWHETSIPSRTHALRCFSLILATTHPDESQASLREALRLAEAAGMKTEALYCRTNLAVKLADTDRAAASILFADVEAEHRSLGDEVGAAQARVNLAVNTWFLGDVAGAWSLFASLERDLLRPLLRPYHDLFHHVVGFESGLVSRADLQAVLDAFEEPDAERMRVLPMVLGARLLQRPLDTPLEELEAMPSLGADITSCLVWLREHAGEGS